ncbi:hypothetical protein F5887DRAFT_1077398 [Amanita rubescens]|nr:hypothetical protein F5887DRAFT_1077398 [Amanita rubescens]
MSVVIILLSVATSVITPRSNLDRKKNVTASSTTTIVQSPLIKHSSSTTTKSVRNKMKFDTENRRLLASTQEGSERTVDYGNGSPRVLLSSSSGTPVLDFNAECRERFVQEDGERTVDHSPSVLHSSSSGGPILDFNAEGRFNTEGSGRFVGTNDHGNGYPPVFHFSSSGSRVLDFNTTTLSHINNLSAPHVPQNIMSPDTTDTYENSSGVEGDVDYDTNGDDTDTDASQFSIPRCTSIGRNDVYDADIDDSGSVYHNLESDDGYDADDEDDGDNTNSI